MSANNSFTSLIFIVFSWLCIEQANAQTNTAKAKSNTVTNFDKGGKQVTRFNTVGDAIDAHDGEIALFNGTYYLYGTSYDCGFEWGNKSAPFCGFKTYTSTDLVNWTDRGFLFDAQTQVWQTRCNGNTYGCFRPHVIFNQKTGFYVLWINVYDNVSGYRVFSSKSPVGPFTEQEQPKLAVNSTAPAAGLNNGDHDTFVDDDGTAYLAYTDWRTNGTIVIEKLSDDYLTGTGQVVKGVTAGRTEAPGMFKRKGIYYVVYSDPNCGYCSGTGASYKTATSPLGPWSEGKKISDNSCGGQPSFVSTIKLSSGTVFLFGSDLWNNAAKNEALANYYWAPLTFAADGAIIPMTCDQAFKIQPSDNKVVSKPNPSEYKTSCDISKNVQRSQSFTAASAGTLNGILLTTFKTGYPNAGLEVSVFKADKLGKPLGEALSTEVVPVESIGWSAKQVTIRPKLKVKKGVAYCMVIKSAATTGCYGFAYSDTAFSTGIEQYSSDGGITFKAEVKKVLKYRLMMKTK
ncbi:family 43 glycosylhydrolase [Mucilaginibacter dorajii]|uniref:Family 43 glycosylhydrolase n=1 Tax=Mucilaginibacter dorajii TaxID=692994 RepID=A0ABP7QHR3_9SPHI|nr:family 43 glycosylhydrolase [Mucilaginibacter dorajii]MCS3734301.1 hypothetical protein [Mucilaginibacter dorajii]